MDVKAKTTRDISKDDLGIKIMSALQEKDMSHEEIIALGDNPRQVASVLEIMQVTGLIESYCGPIQPSSCMYRLAGKI
jgi:hypothetical protein